MPTGDYRASVADDCDDNDATIYTGAAELCDAKNNDCDDMTADGSDVATYGDLCDGPDTDDCREGSIACNGSSLFCTDTSGNDVEGPPGDPSCADALDNDCDGDLNYADADCCGGFLYRKLITIDAARVRGNSGSLANYPVLVSIASDGDLATHVISPDGNDIVFEALGGACGGSPSPCGLDHEIESWDPAGTLVAWVRIPSLAKGSNTQLFMYYGDGCLSSPTPNPSGVWDNAYVGVWHLSETGTGVRADSAGNHDATPSGFEGDEAVVGKVAGADHLDGANDFLASSQNIGISANAARTVTYWVHLDNTDDRQLMVVWGSNGEDNQFGSDIRNSHWYLWGYGDDWDTGIVPTTGVWVHHAIIHDGTTTYWYVNASELGSDRGWTHDWNTVDSPVWLGGEGDQSTAYHLTGSLDEVRISNTNRSIDWVLTGRNNQNWPNKAAHPTNGFISVGAEQDVP